MIKQCVICGKTFDARDGRQKICCAPECKRERKRLFMIQYRQKNKEKLARKAREYSKRGYAKLKQRKQRDPEFKAKILKQTMIRTARYRQKLGEEEYRRRCRLRYQEHKAEFSLRIKKWYNKHKEKILRRKYIIRKLKRQDEGKKVKPFCMHCGKTFKPDYAGQKYCSPACYKQSPLYRLTPDALAKRFRSLLRRRKKKED